MRSSTNGILTTQAGSLPRPDELIELNASRRDGEVDDAKYRARLDEAVSDLVARQRRTGLDFVGDGEFGKATSQKVDYGAWWSYSFQRLGGLELADTSLLETTHRGSSTGDPVLTSFANRRDRVRFADAYADPTSGVSVGGGASRFPVCRGPLTYTGQEAVQADIAAFKQALAAAGLDEGFMTSIAPGSCSRIGNEYYDSDEEFLHACADAMREEYKAIVDAGLVLQLDDPAIAENWDQMNPAPSVEDYKRFTMRRVEALNYAIRDLPKDRIRFHLCWGSWHGPHTTDLPMRDLVDVLLSIDVQAYSFEAGNVRHEHEWKVWRDVTLPEGKLILPGVVSHATNVVEHPELVADRIVRFAECVGRENVIASTDCGLGGRLHPQLAWAKLESLTEGAALATERLWS
ncbi:5-methyltetrahydropteroyltriglutamate--homocysteine methyltransferase [Saccharopolyspora lacisalsi]|uniref:5-methyltetrahydropteroyltriglutamate--homocysteine methyltransferase n=1 Tax=Halosaccharopolyspora lacisalsi TaxID=1000566 RepID=A0A839DX04_9PSEU|nr:cobalamin-independent methionine synthase II family protein [Halosaccharopolyspora lacisalsi]MBA8826502.1 5-methyltetrahydropteroyltriglutamate--homocysteine methyltransferase [Halosaccharopolyspora lacisalsi]